MYFDPKLDFLEHLKNIHAKVNKSIALLQKLQTILPRPTLLTIYKAFIRPHLDYGDTMTMHTMILFIKNWSQFIIMPPLQ